MTGDAFDQFTELEESIRDMAYLAVMLIELGTASTDERFKIYPYAGNRLSEHAARAQAAFEALHDLSVKSSSAG